MLRTENNKVIYHYDAEELWIEGWGANGVRVRSTKNAEMADEDWALNSSCRTTAETEQTEDGAWIRNGKLLMEEYWRNRRDVTDRKCSAIEVEAREFRPNIGGDYHLTMRWESLDKDEKLYGMGQYQQPYLDLKGLDMELAHRNSQASVPFLISSHQWDTGFCGTIRGSEELFWERIS